MGLPQVKFGWMKLDEASVSPIQPLMPASGRFRSSSLK
jgi:hypothetical protein